MNELYQAIGQLYITADQLRKKNDELSKELEKSKQQENLKDQAISALRTENKRLMEMSNEQTYIDGEGSSNPQDN